MGKINIKDGIDLYQIEGRYIKYLGYVYPPEDEDDEDEARLKICEVCFTETTLKTALKKGLRAWADEVLETSKTYLEDTDED